MGSLEDDVLAALQPRGLRERARVALSDGYTAAQVVARLPQGRQEALGAGVANPEVAWRRAVDAVAETLRALSASGAVRRARAALKVDLRSKGARNIEVDVYRLA